MDNYWNNSGKYQKEFDALWEKHVPASGNSETLAGEMIRAAGRLMYDFYNNGMGNDTSGAINFLRQKSVVDSTVYDTIHYMSNGRVYRGDYGDDSLHRGITQMIDNTVEMILNNPQLELTENTEDIFDFSDDELYYGDEDY